GDEPFMRRFGAINSLKLRASWGVTGNTSVNPYQTQGTLASKLYPFGPARVRGYKPGSIPNPDLGWEKTANTNIGLEYALFSRRVSGSVDVYNPKTTDLLLTRLLPVTSGFTSTLQNVGETKNKGVELALSTVNLRSWHGVTWTMDVNWAHNQNEITALQTGRKSCVADLSHVGMPI